MKRFFKQKLSHETTTESPKEGASNSSREPFSSTSVKKTIVDLNSVPSDPAQKNNISECHPNQVDEIRRAYLLKGPCQPRNHDFPKKMIENK
ncbi:zinc finger MYM-type protein 1-like [Iris pallida]|uniref:Zinc finger MYM-type protein 1-like n=1 Tax=Iris pallida TaxID=29817 RepID=A0AAX6G2G4_IRIPA|nr:zinc finger MYM-type protein 1-like [Iris pallida]